MPTVRFVNEKIEIQVPQGANLRKEALAAGVGVYSGIHKVLHCPGLGACGSCRVMITKGIENASAMGMIEKLRFHAPIPDPATMAYIGNESNMRLSCQTRVMGDMEVKTKPPLDLYGENFFS